jgi:histidine triad (HIT) family protein
VNCVFCAIAEGKIPAAKLHQDEQILAFLDLHPLAPGHALIIPRRHAAKIQDAAEADLAAMARAAKRLVPALCAATGAPDATLGIHDGPLAGQEIPHLHLHIVPRRRGDGAGPIHSMFARPNQADPAALNKLAAQVRERLGAA